MSEAGPPDLKAMNRQMVDRLLASPAPPVPAEGYGLRVLEVRGRHTGQPRRTPVGLLDHHGQRYLVTPDRARDWPTNLQADPAGAIVTADGPEPFTAREIHGDDAAEVVSAYLAVVTVPWAIAAFAVGTDTSPAAIAPQVDRMAVFRLDPPADGTSSRP